MLIELTDASISLQFDNLKINVIRLNYGYFSSPYPMHMHGDSFYEVHFVDKGNGKLISSGQEYALTDGALYMTGPFVSHEQFPSEGERMYEYCFQFEITENNRRIKPSKEAELLKNTYFWIGTDKYNIRGLFEAIGKENETKEIGYVQSVCTLVCQILIALVRNYSGSTKAGSYAKMTPDNKRMIITGESFLFDYASLTLEELSHRLNLSLRQTQRFLQKTYDKTFMQMRAEARRNKAEEYIQKGMSPEDAALKVGYKDVRSLKL